MSLSNNASIPQKTRRDRLYEWRQERICARRGCEIPFQPKQKAQIFHSPECRAKDWHESKMEAVLTALEICDKAIERARGVNRSSQQYRDLLQIKKELTTGYLGLQK